MSDVVMMGLGSFRFSLDTAAFDELVRSTGYAWPDQARIGTAPALQFTGLEVETMTLRGQIYPTYRGGLGQIDAMRDEAAKAIPLTLVDGRGKFYGRWVIDRIEEGQRVFWADGVPRVQSFTLNLRRYDNG